jgi:hypothetical protein
MAMAGRVLLAVAAAVLVVSLGAPVHAQDPADSWLSYTISEGQGKLVTFVNATWKVPSYPKFSYGSNAPGFWFGIEPTSMDDLIQPILAWGDGTFSDYTIFNGRFTWSGMVWWQSRSGDVKPGQTIDSYVRWIPEKSGYEMYIACRETGWSVKNFQKVSGETFSNVVFVLEHQPDTCSAYPANGEVLFTGITVEREGKRVNPQWTAKNKVPARSSQAHVLSPSSVSMTWTA